MKNKKNIIGLVILLISVAIITTSITYAYFKPQTGSGAKTDVNIQTGTVDSLTFDKCSPINLTMTQQNFGENSGNQEGSTCVKAILTANDTTSQATETYNVYLDIKSNNFDYTTAELKPEIIMQVTDPNGNAVTSISGLTYDTTLQGFDITTKKGLIQIASNYEIKVNNASENPKTEEWQIKVILRNLDSDQSANAGKEFNADALIQKDFIPTYWNNGFVYFQFNHPAVPAVVYNSVSDIPELDTIPIYIKTDSENYQVCLHHNNRDFCMKSKYWDYNTMSNVNDVINKLRTDMTNTLGVAPTSCNDNEVSPGVAMCYYGNVVCSANIDGTSMCRIPSMGNRKCVSISPQNQSAAYSSAYCN